MATAATIDATGIHLSGLTKSFRTAQGTVHAVRGVDIAIGPGETVALLGPNGAGKSTTIDMLLGLTRPDAGDVTVLGRAPRAAVAAGLVGAMLQSGGGQLIRDLSVRELVTMMASLYPSPLDVEGRHGFWIAMRAFAARGKTVLFATHYLEEADAYADRAVLMAHGRVVADGPTTEIRARVGTRTIRATLPDADIGRLAELAGVLSAERHGAAVSLRCSDSDGAIRALLGEHPSARDIAISSAGLEEAFMQLTSFEDEPGEIA